jgi:hypothetical protein
LARPRGHQRLIERGWLDVLSRRLKIVLALAVGAAGLAMTTGLFASGTGINFEPFRGGWHWQAACFAFSEGALSVSLTVILIGLFRRYLNRQRALVRAMSRDAYAAFIIQSPVLVAGTLLLRDAPLPGELKFIILAIGSVAGSFAAAHALRSVAAVRRLA